MEQDDEAAEPSALMQTYLRRYEALQQERLRSRRQRASEQFFSPSASAAGSDIERLSEGFQHAVGFLSNRYDDSVVEQQYAANGRNDRAHEQHNQRWSYAEHSDGEEARRQDVSEDDVFSLPSVDRFAREQQHEQQQYDPFQDALAEQQVFPSDTQQGVSMASEEFVDAGAFLCCEREKVHLVQYVLLLLLTCLL